LPKIPAVAKFISNSDRIKEGVIRLAELKSFLQSRNLALKIWFSEDATRIMPRIEYDTASNELVGLVLPIMENGVKVIVFMATALNSNWKILLGYFYVDGLDHQKRAFLLKECLCFIEDLSVEIESVTFDGDASNIKMVEMLGAARSADNLICVKQRQFSSAIC
jgi:hypothetical protein